MARRKIKKTQKDHSNRSFVAHKLREAAEQYREAAEEGDAEAMINLGWCYRYGQGVEQDEKEAVKWYRKAAEQGNANAARNLFEIGFGFDRKYN